VGLKARSKNSPHNDAIKDKHLQEYSINAEAEYRKSPQKFHSTVNVMLHVRARGSNEQVVSGRMLNLSSELTIDKT
jgi:hypothetical protein